MKSRRQSADNHSMLFLLAVLTAGYFAGVVWMRRQRRAAKPVVALAPALPEADQPPASAVGWPPEGSSFETYVDEGFAALGAYLEDGYAA